MPVQTFVQPIASAQSAATHPSIVDAAVSVLTRIGDNFAPHAASLPNMTVVLDPGHLMAGQTLVEQPAQTTVAIVAPAANARIDRVVVDRVSGAVSVVAGAEATVPVAPAIPVGKLPVAQILLKTTTAAISNAVITDERDFTVQGSSQSALLGVQTFTASGTYTPPAGTQKVIVEAVEGGVGGAGAYARALFTSGFSGVAVTVGAGGAATAAGSNSGNAGGATSFGILVSCPGGTGGIANSPAGAPFTVGTGGPSAVSTGGNIINAQGAGGERGLALGNSAIISGSGGPSVFGGGAVGAGLSPGSAGVSPGSGGSGSPNLPNSGARAGGAGATGLVIVYAYA